MVVGQESPGPYYCPRCKGLLYKPRGSSLYWHADSNHPHCTITNIAEASLITSTSADHDGDSETPEGPVKKGKK